MERHILDYTRVIFPRRKLKCKWSPVGCWGDSNVGQVTSEDQIFSTQCLLLCSPLFPYILYSTPQLLFFSNLLFFFLPLRVFQPKKSVTELRAFTSAWYTAKTLLFSNGRCGQKVHFETAPTGFEKKYIWLKKKNKNKKARETKYKEGKCREKQTLRPFTETRL